MYKTTLGTHDPTIIFNEETQRYYMFSTDTTLNGEMTLGTQIRVSEDMKHWTYLKTALDGIPKSVFAYTNPSNLWAPDVIQYEEEYRMYYSASIFGTNESCINLASAKTLEGPWLDQGLVIKTHPNDDSQNAIDAQVFLDKNNNMWMVYGSFFSGIYLVQLDKETGLVQSKGDIGQCIARRPSNVEGAIEGPYIYYNEIADMYYLFTSYDFLGDSYNIRVARSHHVLGPYIDINGLSMFGNEEQAHKNGTKILGSYNFEDEEMWTSIGHNSIFSHQDKQYLVAHTRMNNKTYPHYAYINELIWLKNHWCVPSYKEPIEYIDKDVEGFYFNVVCFKNCQNQVVNNTQYQIGKGDIYQVYTCKRQDSIVLGISGINKDNEVFFGYSKEFIYD